MLRFGDSEEEAADLVLADHPFRADLQTGAVVPLGVAPAHVLRHARPHEQEHRVQPGARRRSIVIPVDEHRPAAVGVRLLVARAIAVPVQSTAILVRATRGIAVSAIRGRVTEVAVVRIRIRDRRMHVPHLTAAIPEALAFTNHRIGAVHATLAVRAPIAHEV